MEIVEVNKLTLLVVAISLTLAATSLPAGENFRTHCKGRNEVPPVSTRGQCQANFRVTADGAGLEYRLNVANLEAVTQAHIHLAPAGMNGPVVAFLYGFVPQGSSGENGTLAQGILSDSDLIGPLSGMSIADLVDALIDGDAYVNVHTQSHPPGEVRGQIR